jgi:hypothetical protein
MPAKTAQAGLLFVKSGCTHFDARPFFFARVFIAATIQRRSAWRIG